MEKLLFFITITQIIVESLPISSSGHVTLILILAKKIWQNQDFYFLDILDPLLHISAFIAILITFYKDWMPLLKKLFYAIQPSLSNKKESFAQKKLVSLFLKIIYLGFTANLVTSIFYYFFKIKLKTCIDQQNPQILLFGFCCTALILFSIFIKQRFFTTQSEPLNLKKALILGTVQGFALIPGISRFASTFAAGCWLNISPKRAFQLSFLLHFPLIVASFIFQGLIPFFKNTGPSLMIDKTLIIAATISTIIATLLLMLMYKLAKQKRLWLFCFYMIIPIVLLIIIMNN